MGHVNSHHFRTLKHALQDGDAWEADRQALLIDASQRACPHPLRDRRIRLPGKASVEGKYRKGQRYMVCRRCSLILERDL